MATSDELTLAEAFEQVTLTVGEASALMHWLGAQFADTPAGAKLSAAGASLTVPIDEPVTARSTTSKSSS